MKLCVDVGNTTIRLGIFKDDKLSSSLTFDTFISNYKASILSLDKQCDVKEVKYIIYSSVVPSIDKALLEAIKDIFINADIYNLHDIYLGQVMMDIANPKEVGSDLIADLVGANKEYLAPMAVIDLGTATKILLIDKNMTFSSALILPGIKVSADSLTTKTALLPEVELNNATSLMDSKSTSECIRHGVVFGHIEAINGLITRYEKELGYPIKRIVTGGAINIINKHLDDRYIVDEYLLFKGELIILNDYLRYKEK